MWIANEFMELLGNGAMVSVAVHLQASGLLGLFFFLINSTFLSTLASCWVSMLKTVQ